MSGVMQRVLRGELPVFRVYWTCLKRKHINSFVLAVELYWSWEHYEETHGLPRTPWRNEALNDVPF